MTNSCNDILFSLRELRDSILGNDQWVYNNHIVNGILNTHNEDERVTNKIYKSDLSRLNIMSSINKKIIKECLIALNYNYVVGTDIYNDIRNKATDTIVSFHEHRSMWHFALLKIHFMTMMNKIYFVWKKNGDMYKNDINNFLCIHKKLSGMDTLKYNSCYADFRSTIYHLSTENKYADVEGLFKFLESLIEKYKLDNQ
jgi:hypothetical protein